MGAIDSVCANLPKRLIFFCTIALPELQMSKKDLPEHHPRELLGVLITNMMSIFQISVDYGMLRWLWGITVSTSLRSFSSPAVGHIFQPSTLVWKVVLEKLDFI